MPGGPPPGMEMPDPSSFEGTYAKRLAMHAWVPVALEGLPLALLLGGTALGVVLAVLVWRLAAPVLGRWEDSSHGSVVATDGGARRDMNGDKDKCD